MNRTLRIVCFIALFPAVLSAAPATAPSSQTRFMRFIRQDDGGGQLQAATVRYENADRVSVDLVAAVHIADPAFYDALDHNFDDYDAVLFERVQSKSTTQPATKSFAMVLAGMSQLLLSGATGLRHQLHGINYKGRSNFIHADMDAETFQQMQKQRGETLLSGVRGRSRNRTRNREEEQAQQRVAQDILLALVAPDRPRRMKLAMAELFDKLGDATIDSGDREPTVIIDERNRVALNVLSDVLKNQKEKRTIAIFYGAAHLKGMEKILVEEMGFHQVGPPMWRTAWDIPPAQSSATTQRAP